MILAARLTRTHPQGDKARYRRGGLVFTTTADTLIDTDDPQVDVEAIKADNLIQIHETDWEPALAEGVVETVEPMFCTLEGCPAATKDEGFVGFEFEPDLAQHLLEAHGKDALRRLADGELVLVEHVKPVDLQAMSRVELDAHAESLGIEGAAKLPNKDAVIAAIESLPSLEEENAVLKAKVAELAEANEKLQAEVDALTKSKAD